MWHVETAIDYQPEELNSDSGAGAGAGVESSVVVYHDGLQEKKLTWEEWNDASNHGHIKNKPTVPNFLKIPRELQEGKRLLQLQRSANGGAATVASHGPQLANGGPQANVSFNSHHRCLVKERPSKNTFCC